MTAEAQSELRVLSRGLAVLTALNEAGPLTLAQLSHRLDLPRTNVRRIVATLMAEGCCTRLAFSALYALAPGVQRLTAGYGIADRLTAAWTDILPALSRDIGWPTALAVPQGLIMRVRLSTDFANPFALARMRPGYAVPQVETTTGLLYLASLEGARAAAQLDEIYSTAWRSPLRFNRQDVEALIARARQDDYLLIEKGFPEASLGIPLRVGGHVEAGLVVRYVRSAVSRGEANDRLLPHLRAAAAAAQLTD